MEKWMRGRERIIKDFLKYINERTDDFVLKGGTALRQCYGLDRFSEDIDLDSLNKGIEACVKGFCDKNKFSYNKKKDTDTVKRFMVDYGDHKRPLKIEVSYRETAIDKQSLNKINGIEVYDINSIAAMKASAYLRRIRIRDMYDICYISNNFYDQLTAETKEKIRESLLSRGLEHFDLLAKSDDDPLTDRDKLLENFLTTWDKMGLGTAKENEVKTVDELIDGAKKEVDIEHSGFDRTKKEEQLR